MCAFSLSQRSQGSKGSDTESERESGVFVHVCVRYGINTLFTRCTHTILTRSNQINSSPPRHCSLHNPQQIWAILFVRKFNLIYFIIMVFLMELLLLLGMVWCGALADLFRVRDACWSSSFAALRKCSLVGTQAFGENSARPSQLLGVWAKLALTTTPEQPQGTWCAISAQQLYADVCPLKIGFNLVCW